MTSTCWPSEATRWSAVLRQHSLALRDKYAYVDLESSRAGSTRLKFPEIETAARRIGGALADAMPRQSSVLILLPQDLCFIEAFLACLLAGVIAIPAYLPLNGKHVKKVRSIFADARPRAILWSKKAAPYLRDELTEQRLCTDAQWIDIDDARTGSPIGDLDIGPDELAMLQYTSGSSSDPKGVMLTHRNLLANQAMIRSTFGHSQQSVVLGCLPFYHDMGLIGNLLQPLYVGASCLLLSAQQVVRNPRAWLENISRHRVSTSGGPNAYYELCIHRIEDTRDLDLSCWKVAFNGSEPVRQTTLEAFSRKFASCGFERSAFLPVYGLAEASLLVTGRRKGSAPSTVTLDRADYESGQVTVRCAATERPAVQLVGCGLPAEAVQVAIRGEDGRDLGEGRIGEILVRSASVARGYWGARSSDTFEAELSGGTGERYLRTGDLGFLLEGELFVCGRSKETMIIRGRNFHPQDIEATVTGCSDVWTGCRTAAFSMEIAGNEEVVVLQEVTAGLAGSDLAGIRAQIARCCWVEHELHLFDIVLVRVGTIPRTTSGKTRRSLAKQLYGSNQLARVEVGETQAPQVCADLQYVRACLIDCLKAYLPGLADRIDGDTSLGALGLDSYGVVRISEQVSGLLGVRIPFVEFARRSSLDELALEIVRRRTQWAREVAPTHEKAPAPGVMRQTHGQIALWNREKHAPTAASIISRAVRVAQVLDAARFVAAAATLMRHYEVLRLQPQERGGELLQVLAEDREPHVACIDAREWPESQVEQFLSESVNSRLDLERGETWRWSLLTRAHESVVLFRFHHIVSDLETVNFLVWSLFAAYAREPPEPVASYARYVDWQYAFLESDAGRHSAEVWTQALQDVDLKIDLMARKGRRSTVPGSRHSSFDRPATLALSEVCRDAGVGLNTLLLASLAMALQPFTHQEKFAIAIPVSARVETAFQQTLGYLVNLLPVRVDFEFAGHLGDLLRQVQENTLSALDGRSYPLPLIVQRYRRDRPGLAQELDLPNVVFSYQKARSSDGQDTTAFAMNESSSRAVRVGGMELYPLPVEMPAVEFPLAVTAGTVEECLTIQVRWDDGVLYGSVVDSIVDSYESLLHELVRTRDLASLPVARHELFAS